MVKFKGNNLTDETECKIPQSVGKKMQQQKNRLIRNPPEKIFFKRKHKEAAQLRW